MRPQPRGFTDTFTTIKSANDKAAQSIFLSEYFKQHGYYTAAVGKVFHQAVAEGSFDVFGGRVKQFGPYAPKPFKWDKKGTGTDWGPFPERDEQMPDYDSANWLVNQIKMQHDKPFFIAGGFLRPHVPWTHWSKVSTPITLLSCCGAITDTISAKKAGLQKWHCGKPQQKRL